MPPDVHPYSWVTGLAALDTATPAYIYSCDELARQLRALKKALGTALVLSIPACPNPDVHGRIPEDVRFGARATSRAEMSLVAGWKSDLSFLGMAALDSLSAKAVLGGKSRLVVDTPDQIETLAKARGARPVMPISLCLNIGLISRNFPDLRPAGQSQGMDFEGLQRALDLAKSLDIPIGGIQMYGGAHSFRIYSSAIAETVRDLLLFVEETTGYPLETVTLGAGLEDDWWSKDHDFGTYRVQLAKFPSHVRLIHEIGRAAFAAAGVFATKIVAIKTVFGQRYAVCDGGMVQALRLTEAAGDLRVSSVPFVKNAQTITPTKPGTGERGHTIVLGSSGLAGDVLCATDAVLAVGDILYFPNAGAYVQSFSPNQYLGFAQAQTYVHT